MINKRWVALWSVLLVIGICFSCEHEDSVSKSMGQFSLRLSADTTSIMKDLSSGLTKSVASELEDFANIADYTVLVMKEKDTVVHYKRFDQMPASISLAEGAYQLIAKKGEDKPAEFLNPYFEGSTSFTIKEQMNTPLELTCTLANARVTVDYTNDFLEAYDEYTALLSTPFTTADVELPKGETRAVYLQVASGGTQMAVGIKLKKKTETAAKTYWVQTPINLARRQNVHLIFKTDGEALEGIGLDVVLDKELEKLTFTTTIPDFMWQQFKEPTLEAVEFADGETVSKLSGQYRGMQIGVSMKAGIQELYMKYWRDDEEDAATVIDLVKDKEIAIDTYHLTWLNSVTHDRNGDLGGATLVQIDLSSLIAELDELEDRELYHHFTFYGVDMTPKQQETKELSFVIKSAVSNAPEIALDLQDNMQVVEGNAMDKDAYAALRVDTNVNFDQVTLTINEETFSLQDAGNVTTLKERHIDAKYVETEHLFNVTFEKAFTSAWTVGQYTIKLYVKDSDGNETSVSKSIVVKDPNVQLLSTDDDAFAKRIVLKGSLIEGAKPDKLFFQYYEEEDWKDISSDLIDNGHALSKTWVGRSSDQVYQVRAAYQVRPEEFKYSETVVLKTEEENLDIPNRKFEEWSIEPDGIEGAKNEISVSGNTKEPYRYWEIWQPWITEKGWNTLNLKTTQDGSTHKGWVSFFTLDGAGYPWTRYTANSGTIRSGSVGNYSAEIRTVGWGLGSSAAGTNASVVKHSTPGELYLGTVGSDLEPIYGYAFSSRPSGFSFDYRYENLMKGNDEFTAEIVVLDAQNQVITEQQFTSSTAISDWKKQTIYLDYPYESAKAAKIYIRFVSGKEGDYKNNDFPINPPFSNLSNGEFVGSQLYIDNVELIYE